MGSSERMLRLRGSIAGETPGDRGVGTIGETHDEVGVGTTPHADDRDLLPVERVMRMGDGYRFRR